MKASGIPQPQEQIYQLNEIVSKLAGKEPPRSRQAYEAAWLEELVRDIWTAFGRVHKILCEFGFRHLDADKLDFRRRSLDL
jgi:hypothetical protein